MKKHILFLFVFLYSHFTFAQVSQESFLYLAQQNYGKTFQEQVQKTKEVLVVASQFAEENGIAVKPVTLKTKKGEAYPALVIDTVGSSVQNKEAARVAKVMGRMPLVLSPLDLSRGSNAFFDPDGSKLGVPYNFFTDGLKASSYLHELHHAGTYQSLLNGKEVDWAGTMKVTEGFYISLQNRENYFRFASLDEIVATALSIKLDSERLTELERIQTPHEFKKSRGKADGILGDIYHDALAGKGLARQVADVAKRAVANMSQVQTKLVKIAVGQNSKDVYESLFLLDSYGPERPNGKVIPKGLSFMVYSVARPSAASLTKRLQSIEARARQAESSFSNIEKSISVKIMYPQIDSTDIRSLGQVAPVPFQFLNR